tara:strand:+ start:377 stop:700 length:324 start_codon:yes stop_codon:yes gene_type:complete
MKQNTKKENRKSFQNNEETSPNGHIPLYEEKFSCSLCKMEFDASDKLIESIKKRHEEWHNSKLASKFASTNKIFGKVSWNYTLIMEIPIMIKENYKKKTTVETEVIF